MTPLQASEIEIIIFDQAVRNQEQFVLRCVREVRRAREELEEAEQDLRVMQKKLDILRNRYLSR